MRLIFFHSGDLKPHIMIKFAPAQEEVKTMKTVVIEGKDLLFTLYLDRDVECEDFAGSS